MSKSQRRLLAVNIVVHSLSLSRQITRLADKFVTLHDYAVYNVFRLHVGLVGAIFCA